MSRARFHLLTADWTLRQALRAHPRVFPPIHIHAVEAGEVEGTLPHAWNR